jgi:hypothetical protein
MGLEAGGAGRAEALPFLEMMMEAMVNTEPEREFYRLSAYLSSASVSSCRREKKAGMRPRECRSARGVLRTISSRASARSAVGEYERASEKEDST